MGLGVGGGVFDRQSQLVMDSQPEFALLKTMHLISFMSFLKIYNFIIP